jgi:hypothetical protein
MFQRKETKRGKELVTWFKTALLVTVLGLAVLAIEQPRLAASPHGERATADAISHQTASVNVATKGLESGGPTPYFPAQFPPPKGEPEPASPTF